MPLRNGAGRQTREPSAKPRNDRPHRLVGIIAVIIAVFGCSGALAGQAVAASGQLTQVICSDPVTGRGVGGGLPSELVVSASDMRWNNAPNGSMCPSRPLLGTEGILMSATGGSYPVGSYTSLTYQVPQGLELRSGTIWRSWSNAAPNYGYLAANQNAGTAPGHPWAEPQNGAESGDWYTGNISWRGTGMYLWGNENRVDLLTRPKAGWTIIIACVANATTCDFASQQWKYRIYGGRMELYDASDPVVSNLSGTLHTATTLRGTASLEFGAADVGSGVYRALLEVDGSIVSAKVIDSNAGRCRAIDANDAYVFATATPCKTSVGSGHIEFDTRTAPEGTHRIRVLVEDAGGNRTVAFNRPAVDIDNVPAPISIAPPRWSSAVLEPRVGDELTVIDGTWNGADLTFTYRFKRCSAAGSCEVVSTGEARNYHVRAEDIGSTIVGEVVATNREGSTNASTVPTGTVVQDVRRGGGDDDPKLPPTPDPGRGPGPGEDPPAAPLAPITPPNTGPGVVAVPNGNCPGSAAKLAASFGRSAKAIVAFGKGAKLMLTLTCVRTGKPISGAVLDVATSNAGAGGAKAKTNKPKTDARGRATIRLGRGPSRSVAVGWRPDSLARTYAAQSSAKLLVRSRITLRVAPRAVRAGRSVRFIGTLAGAPKGVLLNLQARDGKKWRTFDQVRTSRGGKFAYSYTFKRSRPGARFTFRVAIPGNQRTLGTLPGASKQLGVRIV